MKTYELNEARCKKVQFHKARTNVIQTHSCSYCGRACISHIDITWELVTVTETPKVFANEARTWLFWVYIILFILYASKNLYINILITFFNIFIHFFISLVFLKNRLVCSTLNIVQPFLSLKLTVKVILS